MNYREITRLNERISKLSFGLNALSFLSAIIHFCLLVIFVGYGGQLFRTFAPMCHIIGWSPLVAYFNVLVIAYIIYSDLLVN